MKEYSPKDIVRSGLCIGCGICVSQSQRSDTRMRFDKYGQYKPQGPSAWFKQSSESFSRTCPFSPTAKNETELAGELFPKALQINDSIGRFQTNWVGHVLEDDFRMQGSSGGLVSWVAVELWRKGLIDGVAHVVAIKNPHSEGTYFKYRISQNEAEIREGAKSRYYPVELSEILTLIRDVPGRYAVVAVPCMIKGLQLLRRKDPLFHDRICFTLGLFCGHMKSSRFVESFAWQMNVPPKEIKQLDYRHKLPDRPANWYNTSLTLNDSSEVNRDWWHLVDGDWGAGFFMNSACNFCDDVVSETADVSFGDAWIEPYSSDGRGTNVVITRSVLINSLISTGIADGRLKLEEVDGEFVAQTQAAGLRQRREGLAYRLTWAYKGLKPVKRVAPHKNQVRARKCIYKMRFRISEWSHRFFWFARKLEMPAVYLFWARCVAAVYHGMAYHNGNRSEMKKRFNELGGRN